MNNFFKPEQYKFGKLNELNNVKDIYANMDNTTFNKNILPINEVSFLGLGEALVITVLKDGTIGQSTHNTNDAALDYAVEFIVKHGAMNLKGYKGDFLSLKIVYKDGKVYVWNNAAQSDIIKNALPE